MKKTTPLMVAVLLLATSFVPAPTLAPNASLRHPLIAEATNTIFVAPAAAINEWTSCCLEGFSFGCCLMWVYDEIFNDGF